MMSLLAGLETKIIAVLSAIVIALGGWLRIKHLKDKADKSEYLEGQLRQQKDFDEIEEEIDLDFEQQDRMTKEAIEHGEVPPVMDERVRD